MNTFQATEFTGAVTLDFAAAAPNQPVRQAEFGAQLSGKSDVGHTHTLDDILNEPSKLAMRLAGILAPTPDLTWTLSGAILSGRLRIKPGSRISSTAAGVDVSTAGLMATGDSITASQISDFGAAFAVKLGTTVADTDTITWQRGSVLSGNAKLDPTGGLTKSSAGLAVDPAFVMLVGSTITASQISDFGAAFAVKLGTTVADTDTITWQRGSVLSGNAKLDPTGGLTKSSAGIAADFGTGHNQVARGDHGHSQLHNPVTVSDSNSVDFTLAGQGLSASVIVDPVGGLEITASGLRCIFGTAHTQVARGDSVLSGTGAVPLVVTSTPSVLLGYDNSVLSATARVNPTPSAGYGKISITAGGLAVLLGTTSDTSAAGNHTHTAATESNDGFMSAADKLRLDNLTAGQAFDTQQFLFTREGAMLSGQYLLGHYDCDIDLALNRGIVRANTPPQITTIYAASINGVISSTVRLTLLSGQSLASAMFSATVPLGQVMRWVCLSGVTTPPAALGVAIVMEVVPG